MGVNCPFTFDENDFDFDGCNITEVIKFLQRLAETPNSSEINVAFTKHITNAIMQIREEKLKYEASILVNVSIIFDATCLFIANYFMFYLCFLVFLLISLP